LPIFSLNVDFSSLVAWSVSCPEGRIEEGKPPDPFVLSNFLPSILPPGLGFRPCATKINRNFSLKNPLAEASLVPLNIKADMTSMGLKLRPTDKNFLLASARSATESIVAYNTAFSLKNHRFLCGFNI
jgi:hypothetical protein